MPASTKVARTSTPRRTSSAGQGRFARSGSASRRSIPGQGLRRRQPEPTGFKKVLSAVAPAAAAKKAAPSSKKGIAGGVALAAAAAGMAFKNRSKLSGLRRKDTDTSSVDSANSASPPATPIA